MKSTSEQWLSIVSNLAILIGILLVFWELQQARTLATVQLRSDNAMLTAELSANLMGENPQAVLSKACLKPDELTTEDKIIMSQIFQNRLAAATMLRQTERIAGIGRGYVYSFETAFLAMFNYEFGRQYFERMKDFAPGEEANDIIEIGERVLALNIPSDCSIGSVIPGGF